MFELQSESINEIALAMSKLQGAMLPAIKDNNNPFFRSKYADLSDIWEVCRSPLADNNLAVVQVCDTEDGKNYLVTTLVHSSGQWMRGRYELLPVKNDPQALGSAVTYARRYMLSAILGVIAEDDDGEAAMQRNKQQAEQKAREKAQQAENVEFCTNVAERVKKASSLSELAEAVAVLDTNKRNAILSASPNLISRIDEIVSERRKALESCAIDWESEYGSIMASIKKCKSEDEVNKIIDEDKEAILSEMQLLKKDLYHSIGEAYQKKLSEFS